MKRFGSLFGSLKVRLLFIVLSVMLVGGGMIGYQSYNESRQKILKDAEESLNIFEKIFQDELASKSKDLSLAMEAFLKNQDVVKAFALRDREKVKTLTLDFYTKVLKPKYGIKQFQFHLPPAISFFRVHKPQKFGDDLSSFRKTVVTANREKNAVVGLEVGRAGPGLRIVYPVFSKGAPIGSVEFGGDIKGILSTAHDTAQAEYGIGIFRDVFRRARRFKKRAEDVQKGDLIFYDFSNPSMREFLARADRKKFNGVVRNGSSTLMCRSFALQDYSGNTIGKILAVKDITSFIRANVRTVVRRMLWIAFFALGVSLAVFLLLRQSVLEPLHRITRKLRDADITEDLEFETVDEMKEMIAQFNRLLSSLRDAFSEIGRDISALSDEASGCSAAAEKIASAAAEQQQQVVQVAAASTEMSQTIQDVAKNAAEASDASRESLTIAQSGREEVDRTEQRVQSLAESVNHSTRTITELGKSSREIGEIVLIIRDITDQTNLLALNAAIEAARAGENGRGFAVVADEVRKLAEKTAKATHDIEERIRTIQTDGENSVAVMEEGKARVEEVVEMTRSAAETLEKIVGSSNRVMEMVERIATATEEQSSAAEEISQSMEQISREIEDTTREVVKVTRASRRNAELTEAIARESARFKMA